MGNYDDIINLPHHVSKNHPHMSALDRASQFSPFAALTEHDSAIRETARLTDIRLELDEDKKEELNNRLQMLRMQTALRPEVEITYFVPDTPKTGGSYLSVRGTIKKFDDIAHQVLLENGTVIPINDIYGIECPFIDYGNNP